MGTLDSGENVVSVGCESSAPMDVSLGGKLVTYPGADLSQQQLEHRTLAEHREYTLSMVDKLVNHLFFMYCFTLACICGLIITRWHLNNKGSGTIDPLDA